MNISSLPDNVSRNQTWLNKQFCLLHIFIVLYSGENCLFDTSLMNDGQGLMLELYIWTVINDRIENFIK